MFGYGNDSDFRYNDLIQLNENRFLRNLKRQQYNLANQYEQLKKLLTRGDGIEIYSIGHSLGLTDKTLLKEILEHPDVVGIKLFYYKDREGFRNLNDNIRRILNNLAFNKIISFPNSSIIPQLKS